MMAMNPSVHRKPQQVTLLSMLQNSTASSPSSSSSPLSFRESNSSYYHPHGSNLHASGPYSYSSSLLSGNSSTSASANSNFQAQESFMAHTQNFQFKDINSIFMLGGEATSCSSSDGSCNNQMSHVMEPDFGYGERGGDGTFVDQIGAANCIYSGVEDTQKFMLSNAGGSVSGWTQKQSGLWGENPLDYGLEEIKHLISTTSTCNNFLFDDKKTEERVMYYWCWPTVTCRKKIWMGQQKGMCRRFRFGLSLCLCGKGLLVWMLMKHYLHIPYLTFVQRWLLNFYILIL